MSLARALCVLACLTASPVLAAECGRPVPLRFEVTGKIVRSEVGFTQGLEWLDGKLYESTGSIGGHSGLNTIAPDGKVTHLRDDAARYFGEGLTILNDEVFQPHLAGARGLRLRPQRPSQTPHEKSARGLGPHQ